VVKSFISILVLIGIITGIPSCYYSDTSYNHEREILNKRQQESDSFYQALLKPPNIHYEIPSRAPENFAFKFKYNHGDILDTFKNTYTKDLVVDKDTTIDFALSKTQLDSVYSIMQTIDIINYPSLIMDSCKEGRFSRQYYNYDFCIDTLFRSIQVELCRESNTTRTILIRKLNEFIKRLIQSSDKYKKLPVPNGFYL
jgi:hypothetical protein